MSDIWHLLCIECGRSRFNVQANHDPQCTYCGSERQVLANTPPAVVDYAADNRGKS